MAERCEGMECFVGELVLVCWSSMEVRKKGYIKEGGGEGGLLKVKTFTKINMHFT